MVPFTVTVLGNGSAVPTAFQHPSAQIITFGSKRFLIDCGEGTQMQMIAFKTGHRHIDHIFISHLHGDHFFGLTGLLNTLHLYGRKQPLHLYAPKKLEDVINIQLQASDSHLIYPLIFHPLDEIKETPVYEDRNLIINHFPLKHSIPSYGFVFREKPGLRKLKKSFVKTYNPSIEQMHAIKSGANYQTKEGQLLLNEHITNNTASPRSYAYCSDTAYFEPVIPFIKGVDLLYHEATFDNSQKRNAADKLHSTAQQAALIAQKAKAGRLLLGHFSARFKDKSLLLEEAKEVFSNSVLSIEGITYNVKEDENRDTPF